MSIRRRRLARQGLVIGAAAALAATAAVLSLGPAAHHAGAWGSPPAAGPLVWADDFNGPAGSAPDPGKWNHETGGGGFGNKELEYYTLSTATRRWTATGTWSSRPAAGTRSGTAAGTGRAGTPPRG